MTDATALRKALQKADGTCECRRGCYFCDFPDALNAKAQAVCPCTAAYAVHDPVIECRWPGHAAVREALRVAAEAGWAGIEPGELDAILGEPGKEE